MRARAWDVGLGLAFAALGAGLALAGWRLPAGLEGVPGPGFFPVLIGIGMAALGLGLAASARPGRPPYWERGWRDAHVRQIAGIVALLLAYAALWDPVPFVVRTPLLLVGIFRVAGEPWLRSVLIAAGTTAVLVVVFDVLLRVRL